MKTTHSFYRVLTAKGDGGIATLQIYGPDIANKIYDIFKPFNQKRKPQNGAFSYGKILNQNLEIDEVILTIIENNEVEIHAHGGAISLKKICESIQQNLNIKQDNPLAPNGSSILWDSYAEISSKREHQHFLKNLILVNEWLQKRNFNQANQILKEVETLLSTWQNICHNRRRALVCMAGLPNAGKSSLMNAVAGKKRSLVSQQAKTTRDTITENFVYDGYRFKWIDTAGLHDPDNPLDLASVNQTWKFIQLSELILWLHDSQTDLSDEEINYINEIKKKAPNKTIWTIATKTDLLFTDSTKQNKCDFYLSAETQTGIDDLLKACSQKLFDEQTSASVAPLSQKMVDDLKYLVQEVDLNPANFTILATYFQNLQDALQGYLNE